MSDNPPNDSPADLSTDPPTDPSTHLLYVIYEIHSNKRVRN